MIVALSVAFVICFIGFGLAACAATEPCVCAQTGEWQPKCRMHGRNIDTEKGTNNEG